MKTLSSSSSVTQFFAVFCALSLSFWASSANAHRFTAAVTTKTSSTTATFATNAINRVNAGRQPVSTSALHNDLAFLKIRGGAIRFKKTEKLTTSKTTTSMSSSMDPKAHQHLRKAFAKIAIGFVFESLVMHQVLLYALDLPIYVANDSDGVFVNVVQFVLIGSVVFGSAIYGAVIDNGLSAATQQVLSPNEIPGNNSSPSSSSSNNWYSNLSKPQWNPPAWVFPIMWLVICKPTQFISLWKLKTINGQNTGLALLVYCIHLALGDAWNKTFFGLQQIQAGAVVISTFWTFLVLSSYLFDRIHPPAGSFMGPTCCWVTVAAALNWSIYLKNKQQ